MLNPHDIHLRLPPPPIGSLGDQDLRLRFLQLSSEIRRRIPSPIELFGLEHRLVAHHYATDIKYSALDDAVGRGAHVEPNPRRILGRLSFEAIIYSYWQLFAEDKLTPGHVRDLAAVLGGHAGKTRKHTARSGSVELGHKYFEPPPSENWAEDLLALARNFDDPITSALVVCGAVIIRHPLEDGNGRLARALLWSRLSLMDEVHGPLAALNFVGSVNPAWVSRASTTLGKDGDWAGFASLYLAMLNYAAELTLRLCDFGLIGRDQAGHHLA